MLDLITNFLRQYHDYAYIILFCIIFVETGLVVMPFLPGDSLLFAVGVFAHDGALNPWALFVLLMCAAILGDNVNYTLGKRFGPKIFSRESSRFFKHDHLLKTQAFYEKHGPKTVIMARFVPIVRTFSPFVAGIGAMHYPRFLAFSVFGGALWVGLCLGAGYAFGQNEFVKKRFELIVVAIVLISVLPMVIEVMQHRRKHKAELAESSQGEA